MKIFAIFIICLTAIQRSAEQSSRDSTLPLRERIELLKHQIAQVIEKNKGKDENTRYQSDVSASLEKLEYVDTANQPITPINDNDERKKHGRYHLRQLKTTTETPWARPRPKPIKKKIASVQKEKETEIVADALDSSSEEHKPRLMGIDGILNLPDGNKQVKTLTQKEAKLHPIQDPEVHTRDVFYRRVFEGDLLKHCNKETLHCTDLLTPVLTGQKTNITYKKILSYKDHEVMRLLQLLNEDTTDLTKEEIYSNLYQISNLQIRLFQWDIASLKMLFNVINKGPKRHTWKSLKNGLKRMLSGWHLDFTNVTNLLHQARIFRPPCIANHYAGSTQSSKIFRYTKKVKPRCSETEYNSGSCELG